MLLHDMLYLYTMCFLFLFFADTGLRRFKATFLLLLKPHGRVLGRIARTAWIRPIATVGVAWSVCVSVCVLVTTVSPAKTAEPIEMQLGEEHAWDQGTIRYIGRTSAPPGEYDGSICLVAEVRLSLPLL